MSIKSFPHIHDNLGLNYRLTEMQSALGNYQLKKINQWNNLRNRNANYIIEKVKDLKIIITPKISKKFTHAFYKLYLTINKEFLKRGKSRSQIIKSLVDNGVNASFGSSGRVYAEKAFKNVKTIPRGLPISSHLEENSIMLQVHPTLSIKEIKDISTILRKVLLTYQK